MMATISEDIRYFRQTMREAMDQTFTTLTYYRHYCAKQIAICATWLYTKIIQGFHFGYHAMYTLLYNIRPILRDFGRNILTFIQDCFLIAKWLLQNSLLQFKQFAQDLMSVIKPATIWIAKQGLKGISRSIGMILGIGAAILDVLVDVIWLSPKQKLASSIVSDAARKPSTHFLEASRTFAPNYQITYQKSLKLQCENHKVKKRALLAP